MMKKAGYIVMAKNFARGIYGDDLRGEWSGIIHSDRHDAEQEMKEALETMDDAWLEWREREEEE